MKHLTTAVALAALLVLANTAQANLGPAPSGTVIAEYDWLTGEIVVSVADVNNWFIQSASFGLTGDTPVGIPAGGGLLTDNDDVIGETSFPSTFSYTDLNLGNVAAPVLPFGDLTISSNAGLGQPTLTSPVTYLNPPGNFLPSADINGPIRVNTFFSSLSILLDASDSIDDGSLGPLTYRWDLDDNGIFEVNTGTNPTFEIADVTSTFGGLGIFPVAVEVFDGEFSDIAATEVRITYEEPLPPPSMAQYNPATGEIVVSVYGVNNWYIESLSGGLTGDEPSHTPIIPGSLFTNSSSVIGETGFAVVVTGENVSLGNVAALNLPPGDLSIFWNNGLGVPVQSASVIYNGASEVPEPSTLILVVSILCGVLARRHRAA